MPMKGSNYWGPAVQMNNTTMWQKIVSVLDLLEFKFQYSYLMACKIYWDFWTALTDATGGYAYWRLKNSIQKVRARRREQNLDSSEGVLFPLHLVF